MEEISQLPRLRKEPSNAEGKIIIDDDQSLAFLDDATNEATDLIRVPTFAVFHKLTAGKGVPHTFYGE
jgi:hypothetical protein